MLLTKEVEVRWNAGNKKWYESKGYNYTKMKDKFVVEVKNLNPTGYTEIEVLCDYCKKEIVKKHFCHYTDGRKTIKKDCCNDVNCMKQKREEIMMIKYGVKNQNQISEIVIKRQKTNLKKYGVKTPSQNKEIYQKMTNTIKEIYGVENVSQSDEIKKKKENKAFEKYGVKNVLQSTEIREKIKNTCNQKYGGNSPMSDKKIKQKFFNSLYQNGTAPCSSQQKYVHNLIGGELNYPISKCIVDIAFSEEKIYVECDFSGHWLSISFNSFTEEEFKIKERKRWYALYQKGWKEIRIISRKDKMPIDDKLLEMIKYAKEYLDTGHSWIRFDIDNQIIKCSQFEKYYDFGKTKIMKAKHVI